MSVKISDVMTKRVVTAQPHHTVDHVRGILKRNRISALPITGPEHQPLGIVTTVDLASNLKGNTPIQHVMTEDVRTVPQYNDASTAARIMRKHKIHHVVVTHEKQVVGMISSFDLLKLVEGHRFVPKPGPKETKKKKPTASARQRHR